MKIYDKYGVEIVNYDTLKILHFLGARRKRHYMYKLVVPGTGDMSYRFLKVDHLEGNEECFWLEKDNQVHGEIEVVQGYGDRVNIDGSNLKPKAQR